MDLGEMIQESAWVNSPKKDTRTFDIQIMVLRAGLPDRRRQTPRLLVRQFAHASEGAPAVLRTGVIGVGWGPSLSLSWSVFIQSKVIQISEKVYAKIDTKRPEAATHEETIVFGVPKLVGVGQGRRCARPANPWASTPSHAPSAPSQNTYAIASRTVTHTMQCTPRASMRVNSTTSNT